METTASAVIRSEVWVNQKAKKALENLKLARVEKTEEIIRNANVTIAELRKRPFYRFFAGYPALPKETNRDIVKKWILEADHYETFGKYYWYDAEVTLKRLISATDSKIGLDHKMNLSTEDSVVLEYWSAWKKDLS